MTIKKFLRIVSIGMLLTITIPAYSASSLYGSPKTSTTTNNEEPRVQQLIQRLENIKDMNKSELTNSEKRNLRKEVKDIKKEMKALSGGVYLSVGAIIIVILLLILIL